jgi:FMN-dependent NADH-azoreductase
MAVEKRTLPILLLVRHRYLDQFVAADKIVIAFPLWNFTAPAPLFSYISYIPRSGKTFKYTAEEGPVGLMGDKKVVLLHARGGIYTVEPMASKESVLRPLKATLSLLGIKPIEVIIEGHHQFKDRSEDIISEGLRETAKIASSF